MVVDRVKYKSKVQTKKIHCIIIIAYELYEPQWRWFIIRTDNKSDLSNDKQM